MTGGSTRVLVSGCVGPRGDGYSATERQTVQQARDYHAWQVETLTDAGVDLVSALTMTHTEEAVGVTQAAVAAGVDVVISFTVETDGSLPDGTSLHEAMMRVDDQTEAAPAYYVVNCAHSDHVRRPRSSGGSAPSGCGGCGRHLAAPCRAGRGGRAGRRRPARARRRPARPASGPAPGGVLGGCCGTDARHIAALAQAWR